MAEPFLGFTELYNKDRCKFIEVNDNLLVYNAKDSFLIGVKNLPSKFMSQVAKTTVHPAKTLILHTTYECNFGCNHCYLGAGKKRENEMDASELIRVVKEFGEMGGLNVSLSGGETLLKDGIEDVIREARKQRMRTVVLSNAGNLNREQLQRIAPYVDCIAVGLDGLYGVNDEIRGGGTFKRIVAGLEMIADTGIELSLTTLLTPNSIPQLPQFPEFMEQYGGKSWSLVMPRPAGRFGDSQDLIDQSSALWEKEKEKGILKQLHKMTKSRGISVVLDHILVPGSKRKIEESSGNFVYDIYNKGRACWDNTLTIMPNGDVKCCLFFDGQVYDNVLGKPVRNVYQSTTREKALREFKKFPVDKCPFVERAQLKDFEKKL